MSWLTCMVGLLARPRCNTRSTEDALVLRDEVRLAIVHEVGEPDLQV